MGGSWLRPLGRSRGSFRQKLDAAAHPRDNTELRMMAHEACLAPFSGGRRQFEQMNPNVRDRCAWGRGGLLPAAFAGARTPPMSCETGGPRELGK